MITHNKIFRLFFISLTIISIIKLTQSSQLYSVGKLTVTNHAQKSAVNKTVTLNTLSYYQHLNNLQMLKVRVVKADPLDGCSAFNTSVIFPDSTKTYPDTFLFVDGQNGSCSYWKKAQMAKQALVKGIIIVNDDPQKNGNRPADFNDDGLFLTFLIRPKDANLLMLLTTTQFQGQLSIVQTSKQQQKKTLYLWLSSLNPESYDYLKWWNETLYNLPELNNKIQWQPKYVFYGKTSDQNRHVYSCICNGLFCSPQYHGKSPDALIKQDLRQKLIFKYYPDKYLRYIKLFTDRCLDNYLKDKYAQQCSKTQMFSLQIDESKINNEIYNLQNKCNQDKQLFGQLLADKGRFSMIGTYPIMLLNRQILQVNNQNDLQAAICRKFSLQQTQGCIQNYRTTTYQIVISVAFFVLILVGLFGVGFFIVMCYKNKLRKQMHKQVKMQVSTAVQHYFQLSQDTSSAKN